jgi:peptide/nickel transport system substrate-binding protein
MDDQSTPPKDPQDIENNETGQYGSTEPTTAPELQPESQEDTPVTASSEAATTPETPAASEPAPVALPPTPKKGLRKRTLAGLLVLIVAAAGIASALYLNASNSDPVNDTVAVVQKKDIPLITYNGGPDSDFSAIVPHIDTTNTIVDANRSMFEGLVRYQNTNKIVPLLATGWTNPDSSTWVFTLRHGVLFHTGREMTAADVKASIEASKDTDLGQIVDATIDTVSVIDKYTVKIVTTTPDPVLLNKLTESFIFDTTSGKTDDPINGTGPYVVKPGTTPSATKLELVAFDKYYGGHIYTRALTFTALENAEARAAYEKGTVNFVADTKSSLASIKAPHTTLKRQSIAVQMLPINTLKAGSPLQKKAVRQALYLAIDPAPIENVREETGTPASQIVTVDTPGYNPSVTRPAKDVAKAAQLIKDAGYPNGFSVQFTFFSTPRNLAVAQELQKQLLPIGVTLNPDPITVIDTLVKKVYGGQADIFSVANNSDISDASDVFTQFYHSANYQNDQIDKLLTQASSTQNQSQRLKYLQQASKIGSDDIAVLPLYNVDAYQDAYSPSFVVNRDVPGPVNGVYFWKVYAK